MSGSFASPAARALASELGLADAAVIGTGRDGRVTIADVRRAAPALPDGLRHAGAALYRRVTQEWELRPDEETLLAAAARTVDELASLERALAEASPVVTGSRGQTRAHPLISQVREHRLALRLLLGSLGIDEAEAGSSRGTERSAAGRKLALIRHGGRHG